MRTVWKITAELAHREPGAALVTVQTRRGPSAEGVGGRLGGEGPGRGGQCVAWEKGHPCAEFKSEERNFEKVFCCIILTGK